MRCPQIRRENVEVVGIRPLIEVVSCLNRGGKLSLSFTMGTNKRGRPCREWMDDTVSWCKAGLQELNSLAQDRRRLKLIARQAMDIGHQRALVPWFLEKKTPVKRVSEASGFSGDVFGRWSAAEHASEGGTELTVEDRVDERIQRRVTVAQPEDDGERSTPSDPP